MKSRVVFLVLSALLMVMAGCDDNQSAQSDYNVSNIKMLSDSLKQQLVKQDSLSKELLHQVDILTTELNSEKTEVKQLKIRVEQKESPEFLWTILPMIIGCLALIIAIIVGVCTRHDVQKSDVKRILDEHLEGICSLDQDQFLISNRDRQLDEKIIDLEQRIKMLEGKVADVKSIAHVPSPLEAVRSQDKMPISKHLYANSNSEEYFTTVLETKQDTCVYVIDLESETTGEFEIISIDKIKQRNGWERIVKYSGNCMLNEAKGFKTIQPGLCQKHSDGIWKVTRNLEIKIF